MSYLNSKWDRFRAVVEIGSASVAMIVTGVLSVSAASVERGYHAAGGEVLLTAGAAALAAFIAHKILNRVEVKLNAKFEADYEAKRIADICRVNKVRMYTIGDEQRKASRFFMYNVGE